MAELLIQRGDFSSEIRSHGQIINKNAYPERTKWTISPPNSTTLPFAPNCVANTYFLLAFAFMADIVARADTDRVCAVAAVYIALSFAFLVVMI